VLHESGTDKKKEVASVGDHLQRGDTERTGCDNTFLNSQGTDGKTVMHHSRCSLEH